MTFFNRKPGVARMTPQDAMQRMAEGTLTLLDVRDPGERKMTGTAKGAVAIPLSVLRMQADPRSPEKSAALDPEKPVAIYCASGARSQMAAQALLGMGYREVYNLGGLHNWTSAGGALA